MEKRNGGNRLPVVTLVYEGLPPDLDRALFGICLYTTARINEACSLHTADVYGTDGRVRGAKQFPLWRNRITFRRATTKGKQETRSVPVSPELRQLLEGYRSDHPYLFPRCWGRGHICPEFADAILRTAFKRLGIEEPVPKASSERRLLGCTMSKCRSSTFSQFLGTRACRHYSGILI